MGGMGGGGGSCPTSSATGTLSLRFAGSPLDTGLVNLPPGTDMITVDSDVTLPAGSHDVWAYNIAGDESPFRLAYEPTVPTQTACVRAGQQTIVTVNYRLVETSGLLWLGASNNPTASTMFGYGPTSVGSTGPASALVAANTFGSGGFTFDQWGNMWVIGGTDGRRPGRALPVWRCSIATARRRRTSSSTASARRFPVPVCWRSTSRGTSGSRSSRRTRSSRSPLTT